MKWAEGAEVEYEESPGVFVKTPLPNWHVANNYRIHDPYRELKEAAKDPNKEIALIKDVNGIPYGDDTWHSGDYWKFTEAPDRYAIRDKVIKDPYFELKEAAKDPNKRIQLYGSKCIITGSDFDLPPQYYEIVDKPKATKKVKMWQWLLQNDSNKFFASNRFYLSAEDVTKDHITSKVIGIVPWTEIEVEE
jgi:hypothetical protein